MTISVDHLESMFPFHLRKVCAFKAAGLLNFSQIQATSLREICDCLEEKYTIWSYYFHVLLNFINVKQGRYFKVIVLLQRPCFYYSYIFLIMRNVVYLSSFIYLMNLFKIEKNSQFSKLCNGIKLFNIHRKGKMFWR